MLGFNSQQRYYLHVDPVDMRKGLHSLCGIVRNELESEPTDGNVYIFFSKSYQTVKLLVWDKDGFVVYGKWLARGKYERISAAITENKYELTYHHLVMLLSGVSLIGAKQRPRYQLN